MKRLAKIVITTIIASSIFVGCSNTSTADATATGTEASTEENSVETTSNETTDEATATEEIVPNEDAVDIGELNPIFKAPESIENLPQLQEPKTGDTIATIKTNKGDITAVLYPEYAPKAVENFTTHAKDGYFNGLIFHRVINDFMIQGGDPEGTGMGGESIWGTPFEDEVSNNLKNFRGALSMANSGVNTNGSQFFIVQNSDINTINPNASTELQYYSENQDEVLDVVDENTVVKAKNLYPKFANDYYTEIGGTPHLDFRHTVFGQVVSGLEVVDSIAAVEVDKNSKPTEDVIIETVEISTY
ncbi:MAG: peptidylprolyl isomerase [Lachnospirales bacterium]